MQVIKEAFQLKKEIKTKDCFADLVTETDEKVEKLVISTLQAAYPNHKYIFAIKLFFYLLNAKS